MAATRLLVAAETWVLGERQMTIDFLAEEREELIYPAINHAEFLNEQMSSIVNGNANIFETLKTPAPLRGVKTPAFRLVHHQTVAKTQQNLLTLKADNIADAKKGQPQTQNTIPNTKTEDIQMQDVSASVPVPQKEEIKSPLATQAEQPEEQDEPTPRQPSPVQLYTESDIGSPSIHATPEKPLRKGSFTFAPLPARDPLKQSLGAPATEAKIHSHAVPPSVVKATSRHSLGLDSDDENSAEEFVDLRAPELIAHEARMKAYEPSDASSDASQPEAEQEIESAQVASEEAITAEPGLEIDNEPESGQEQGQERQSELPPSTTEDAAEPPKPQIPRQRATKTAIGRPVRPTLTNKPKPQPVPIKIKSLSQKPINTAPVAAHNKNASRASTQPTELKKKPSTQFPTPATTSLQKPIKPPPSKVFATAQKKKEHDEAKAAQEAAAAQAQRERRDNKIQEIKRKREEEEEELDRHARRNSNEKAKKRLTDLDKAFDFRDKAEDRQEREDAATALKKQKLREEQETRAMRPLAKPVPKSALKCAVPSSTKNTKTIKPAPARTQNAPSRPPARLENHEPSRPASRLDLRDEEMHESHEEALPAYPSNLSKPPVRASIKKPSIFTSTAQNLQNFPQPPRAGPSMQQFATQRIPFATEPAPLQQHNLNTQHVRPPPKPGINTPYAPMHSMQTIQTITGTSPSEMTLPEIHTDSSDDSSDATSLASWATPGHLSKQLINQENINTDMVFPRIPTLSMEEVFRNNPRMAKLRDRTSSANWVRTGDALTQMEVEKIERQELRLNSMEVGHMALPMSKSND